MAQWGFLLEFNLSGLGKEGEEEGEGKEGRQGTAWVSSSMEYV